MRKEIRTNLMVYKNTVYTSLVEGFEDKLTLINNLLNQSKRDLSRKTNS